MTKVDPKWLGVGDSGYELGIARIETKFQFMLLFSTTNDFAFC